IRVGIAFQFNNHAHTFTVGLIAHLGDAVDLAVTRQFGNLLDQIGLVDLVGKLGHDDADSPTLALFKVSTRTHYDASTPTGIHVANALTALNNAPSREVRPTYDARQFFSCRLWILDQVNDAITDFNEIMWWNVGGHTNGDAGRAINQQVGQTGRQDSWLLRLVIVVGFEIDGIFVNVTQQFIGNGRHLGFSVTHGCWWIVVLLAKVALA